MINKNGFTLIELLGSIVILVIVSLVAFPVILNFLTSSSGVMDGAKEDVILGAAKEYVNDNVNDFKRTDDLMQIRQKISTLSLINNGYITNKSIVEDADFKESWVCVSINSDKYVFEFKGEC